MMYTTADAVYDAEERKNSRPGCYFIRSGVLALHFYRKRVESPEPEEPQTQETT